MEFAKCGIVVDAARVCSLVEADSSRSTWHPLSRSLPLVLRYGILGFNVPLDTVQFISETGSKNATMLHICFLMSVIIK